MTHQPNLQRYIKVYLMGKKENVTAGFWSKFLARIIDLVIMSLIVVGIGFSIMTRYPKWHFDQPWKFYAWIFIFFVTVSVEFILIPILFDGKTLGMYVVKIKITTQEYSMGKSVLKREAFFALMWLLNIILITIIINHTLINKYALTKQTDIKYTAWETARISMVSSVGSITIIIQMLFAISSIVRKDKRSLHDVYSKTRVVRYNKFQDVAVKTKTARKIKPVMIEEPEVKWIK